MKRTKFFSLRYKIMIFALSLTIIPILVVGSFSYLESTKIVRKQVSSLYLEKVKQMAYNIQFVIHDVQGISLNLIQNRELAQYLKSKDPAYQRQEVTKIQSLLNDYTLTKPYIYSMYIQGFNGTSIDTQGAYNQVSNEDMKRIKQLNGKEIWSLNDVYVNQDDIKTISLIRLMKSINNLDKLLGVIKINLNGSQIAKIIDSQETMNPGVLFYLTDRNNTILSSRSAGDLGRPLAAAYLRPDLMKQSSGFYVTAIQHKKYLVVYYKMADTGWKLINFVPFNSINQQGLAIKKITLYSIMITLVICFLFILFFIVKVLEPLKQIRSLMKHLEVENFNVRMDDRGNDEIALLGRSFNKMSRRLDELINEVYAAKIKQQEAEFKALGAQINPHFLYNTLDLIYWMGRMEKAFETSETVQALSKLFRLGLNSGSEYTTVGKEVSHLENYIFIQQKRYEDTVEFEIQVSGEVYDCKVVKLILQPLVENALTHGIEKKGGGGLVKVEIYKEGDRLIYRVSDDGAGADEEAIRRLILHGGENNKGFALKNVNDRIKLHFGPDYGLEFASTAGKGTTVTVIQPVMEGEEHRVEPDDRG